MAEYIIAGTDNGERVYWSNTWGWTGIEQAERFTDYESRHLNLPVGGVWVEIK
jgi:hypothetical protein